MNRKLMVAAVAAAFAAPAAFAQTSVTLGGTINILWDNARANGATNSGSQNAASASAAAGTPINNNLKPADRVRDGAGSNIRFSVIEDLGGGNSAFVQVESAVVVNSDQRSDSLGQGGNTVSNAANPLWGNRNTGVGIRSKTAGRFLIGVWDVHYHETYTIDPGWIPGNSAQSILGVFNTFGAAASLGGTPNAFNGGVAAAGLSANATAGTAIVIGGRYSNVIRWDSPNWSGFSIAVNYARPTDGAPPNRPGGSMLDGKRNRAWNFAPKYESGGLAVQYSYLSDRDIANQGSITSGLGSTNFWGGTNAAGGTQCAVVGGVNPCVLGNAGGGTLWKITSNRLGVRYKFANGFGLGAMWDQSKTSIAQETASSAAAALAAPIVYTQGASSSIKRTTWAIPLTYDFGNHHLQGTWAKANSWKGSLNGVEMGSVAVSPNALPAGSMIQASSNTGAKMWSFGYQYNLSQRTNVSLSYATLKNQSLARYDFFANSTGIGSAAYGADPKTYAIGLRHTF